MTAAHTEPHHHEHGHEHGDNGDDHDDGPDGPLEENPIWQQDNVVLHSVGIDIGSSGTQVAFSRLHLRRLSEDLTSRYVVVHRETLYESEVWLTPYTDDLRIDAPGLGGMLDQAYAAARLGPEHIDTGVVILTGEALRRLNAELIASVVSERAGDLVCATAGHHMEATLAAHGSGAVLASHERNARVLNVDIGGGTTKLSLAEGGRVLATAALHIGGRLVVAENGVVTRIEPGGARHAARLGHALELGAPVSDAVLDEIATFLADELLAVVAGHPTGYGAGLWLTDPLGETGDLAGVVFSGGVAEYVYGAETRDFDDLGRRLGEALRSRVEAGALPAPLLPATERIRATVLGASAYTVQLSGITSHVGDEERLLPRRNLQVVQPVYELSGIVDAAAVADSVASHVARFDADRAAAGPRGSAGIAGPPVDELVVALHWSGDPEYSRLRALADGIVKGLAGRIDAGLPLYLMLDGDIARTLGRILSDELGVTNDLVILDGLRLRDFDYVDLGRVRQPSGTVPVTIKSLVFGAMDTEGSR